MGSPLVETDGIYCIFNDSINSGQHASSWELAEKKNDFHVCCHNIETNQFDIDLGCMACFIIEISAGENNVIVQDPLFPVNCQKSSLISSSPFKVS